MGNIITKEKLEKYFNVSKEAYIKAESSGCKFDSKEMLNHRKDFLDMIKRYLDDAQHFYEKDDWINAFAALNYAHGWLDSSARMGLFDVHDSQLFAVDDLE